MSWIIIIGYSNFPSNFWILLHFAFACSDVAVKSEVIFDPWSFLICSFFLDVGSILFLLVIWNFKCLCVAIFIYYFYSVNFFSSDSLCPIFLGEFSWTILFYSLFPFSPRFSGVDIPFSYLFFPLFKRYLHLIRVTKGPCLWKSVLKLEEKARQLSELSFPSEQDCYLINFFFQKN